MIDTVVIKLHRLSTVHSHIAHKLTHNVGANRYYTRELKSNVLDISDASEWRAIRETETLAREFVNVATGEIIKPMHRLQPVQTIAHYMDTGKSTLGAVRGRWDLKSSHYGVAYMVDLQQDYASFSVSIPKFLYGTNVLQAVEHFDTANFLHELNSTFEFNARNNYNILTSFLRRFFDTLFFGCAVDWRFVEIARIDLCFNQVFETETLAREYLNMCKSVKKKHARIDLMQAQKTHADNILYTSSLYAAKIYHKGDEFSRNDMKQLLRLKKSGYNNIDVKSLLQLANRTLRYEITFHSKYISYIYNNTLLRKDDALHTKRKKMYNRLRRLIQTEQTENLEKHHFDFYKKMSALFSRRYKFTIASQTDSIAPNYYAVTPTHLTQLPNFRDRTKYKYKQILSSFEDLDFIPSANPVISPELLLKMSEKLWCFIKTFKLSERPTWHDARQRIEKYNQTHKQKIDSKKWALFFMALESGRSYDEILENLELSRTSAWRYENILKKLGYDKASVCPSAVAWNANYSRYHGWVSNHWQKIFKFDTSIQSINLTARAPTV